MILLLNIKRLIYIYRCIVKLGVPIKGNFYGKFKTTKKIQDISCFINSFSDNEEIFIVDPANNEIRVFTSNFKYIRKYECDNEVFNNEKGEFKCYGGIRGICVNQQTNYLYMCDYSHNRIQIIDIQSGKYVDSIIDNCNCPKNIVINNNHHSIAIANEKNIVVFDKNNKCIRSFGKEMFEFPYGLDFNYISNTYYIVDSWNDNIAVWNEDGKWIESFGSGYFQSPRYIVINICNDKEEIIISDDYRVNIWEQGKYKQCIGGNKSQEDGNFQYPGGLTITERSQKLVVCDSWNYRIQMFE